MSLDFKYFLDVFILACSEVHTTLIIAVSALAIALLVGLLVALSRIYFDKSFWVWPLKLYTSFFRGTPLVVQLFFIYFGLPQVFPAFSSLSAHVACVIGLGLHTGAYMSESMRSCIKSVDHGQYEAGKSLGFSLTQTLRFVVLPQAAKIALAPLSNDFIDLIKGTSLVFTLGVVEVMSKAQLEASSSLMFFESYLAVLLIYWVLISFVTFVQRIIQAKLNKGSII